MNNFIAQLMSGKHRLLKTLAHDSGISITTAKVWLKYLESAGVVDGLALRVDTIAGTPLGPKRLWLMAKVLKLLKMHPHDAADLAILVNCTPVAANTLLRNLTAVGVIDPSTGMLASRLLTQKATAPWVNRLTPTQLVTLRILARTGSIKATARERNITESTVSGMLKLIYSRMGVHSSTAAAYMIGLLDGANS
jgi:DNA-binding CsgD family transcriptional regulator